MSLPERIFQYPVLFRLKRRVANALAAKDSWDPSPYLEEGLVLDLGCGPDTCLLDLSRIRRVGVDLSEPAVRWAKKAFPTGQFLVGDARCLPFPDKAFSATFVCDMLHHIPIDTGEVLSEIARVTRRYLVLIEPLQSESGFPRWIKSALWKLTDGGCAYMSGAEWDELLRDWEEIERLETGLCRHHLKFIGRRKSAQAPAK